MLVVARTEDARTGKLKPCLFVVPTDAAGFEFTAIPMEIISPEKQFQVFLDDVRLPADALVGDEDGGLVQVFAGLNPERIMAASFSLGLARYALDQATAYAKERTVFSAPIGAHQAHRAPAGAAPHRDRAGPADDAEGGRALRRGRRLAAGEAANMAKYAAAEAACDAVDRAIQTHGGNGVARSTAWPACSSPPGSAGSRRSAAR